MIKIYLLSCTVLLLLCAFPESAQGQKKSERVEQYLGTSRYKNECPKGVVKFVFQKAVLKRQGDGKKTFEQLLYNERKFSNRDNAGRLTAIEVVYKDRIKQIQRGGSSGSTLADSKKLTAKGDSKTAEPAPERLRLEASVAPVHKSEARSITNTANKPVAKAVTQVNSRPSREISTPSMDPMRPNRSDKPTGGIQLPDSSTVAHSLDEAKEKITGWKGKMWQSVQPVWEFVMWMFSSLIVVLICFAGICRYVAKTAASESLMNSYGRIIVGRWIVSAHQNAAAMLLIITWIIAIVLLIDVFMWLVFLSLPIWTLLVIWFPILWLAEKLTSWIVPNIPVIGTGGR